MRPTKNDYFLSMARLVATRSTCLRRAVGVVLVNARGHVLATGYNGVPSGFEHCNEGHPCVGANAPSGQFLSGCLATHAEISALSQCHDVWQIDTLYATVTPCFECTKALISSGCRRIVAVEEYPHPSARQLWLRAKREWVVNA